MGIAQKPPSTALFLAVTYGNDAEYLAALAAFEKKFGPHTRSFGPLDFSANTDYYEKEMGMHLKKIYLIYPIDFDREDLAQTKLFTNDIESGFGGDGSRRVNLDPGYITNDKIVLASTKDFFHRIHVGSGIFAEVTLHFRHGKYRFFSWTYPDYREEGVLALLTAARADLVGRTRKQARALLDA